MSARTTLKLMMACYYPFLAGLFLICIGLAAALFIFAAITESGWDVPALVLAILFVLPALHIAVSCTALLKRQEHDDPGELRVPESWLKPIRELVSEVAAAHKLPEPDEIRLHMLSPAHVYEDLEGRRVLVLGGFALAAFPREAIAGIVAHELGHFHGGDTEISRISRFWTGTASNLEMGITRQGRLAWCNPLAWLIRGYHLLFDYAWSANKREQEYVADRFWVEQAGKDRTASTLILIGSVRHLPWSRLTSVAESCMASNLPLDGIFAEQVRRARATSALEWSDALTKSLKATTGFFASHPCLKERLKAIGVNTKRARQIPIIPPGEPLATVIPWWPHLEKKITQHILACYSADYQARKELAQIVTWWARQ